MANNQYVNKVQYGNEVLIDISNDTITANKILSGYTAHDKAGAPITGTIQSKSVNNVEFNVNPNTEVNRVYLRATVPAGYYANSGSLGISEFYMPVPTSSYVAFTVYIPNGTTTPDESVVSDWIPLTIEVDSNGNSNIIDDTIPATGVSF